MKHNKGMLHNVAVLFIAMTLTKIIGAILKIPLGNILGGLGMSYFSAAYSVFSPVYALTTAALPTVITKLVAQNAAAGKLKNIRKIRRLAVKMSLLLGFFGMIGILVITAPFAVYIANTPKSIPAMLVIAPSLFFCCVSAVYRGYYEGLCNMLPTAVSQVIEAFAKAVFGILFSYLTLNRTGSLPLAAAAAVLGITLSEFAGLMFLVIRSKLLGDGISENDIETDAFSESAWSLLKKLYKEMLPITAAALVINLVSLVDLLTITNTINYSIKNNRQFYVENFAYGLSESIKIEELGNFIYGSYSGIVASLFGLVLSMTAMVSRSALPNIASSNVLANKNGFRRNIRLIFKGSFIIGFPLSFGLATLAQPVLSLLYSSKPNEAALCVLPLFILGLFGMSISIAGTLFSIFLAIGRADLVIKLMLLGSSVKLCGNFFLIQIPTLNITGAAISTVLCYTLISITGFTALSKIAGARLGISEDFFKSLLGGLSCGAAAYLSYHYAFSELNVFIRLIASIASAAVLYTVVLTFTDFTAVRSFLTLKGKTKNVQNKRKLQNR